ncbi:MAG TPA: ATP-dependent DNA helicase [Terriglobales bacterium]|nr:ATP-dependent DNA helicase [Terriglobales bacterium]
MASTKSTARAAAVTPDERQREAIEHVKGPMLVIAGAGTGKTTVITRRMAALIREGYARPSEILSLTYTDNAAKEMRERVQAELRGADISGLRAVTFHAYCNELLKAHGRGFNVLDDKDLWIFLRKRIRELGLNYFVRAANVTQFLDDLLEFMRRCQDELVGPEKYAEYVEKLGCGVLPAPRVTKSKDADAISDEERLGRCKEIASVFAAVERMLRADNLGTFGHMITKAHELLHEDPEVLAMEREKARFILVDEFQDANFAQVKILAALAGEERNVFAVGDPDQAIYRFRGASSAAFGLFQRHFPGARLVVLEKNQRSLTPILQCAFALIDRNPPVFSGKTLGEGLDYKRSPLRSAREERALEEGKGLPGALVEIVPLSGRDYEATDIVAVIQEQRRQLRCRWRDFAILYRSHFHRDEIAKELGEKGIPFSIENMDVLDTPEVRALLACVGAVDSTADAASLLRVAALPQFQIDPEKFRAAMRAIPRDQPQGQPTTLAVLLGQIEGGPAVLTTLRKLREDLGAGAKASAVLEAVLRTFRLDRDSPPVRAVVKFVGDWEAKPLTKTGGVGEFLEYLRFFREAKGVVCLQSEEPDAVRLMTAHSAKGLEFAHVFVIRAASGSFPSAYKEPLIDFPQALRDADSAAEGDGKTLHDQEERRLFYVAMTRARDSLTLYGKQGTGKEKTPPGFARELVKNVSLGPWRVVRIPREFQTDLFAGSAPPPAFASRTTQWLEMPPAFPITRLSATAVESYEVCPLQFKLEREWRIPRDVPAAMLYGASMHRVLKTYYESVRLERPLSEDELIELFRTDFGQAVIEDPYQRELYERQGVQQLQDFLVIANRLARPRVLHTEEHFEVKVGTATVAGRIDRIDDLGNGRVAIVDYKTGKPRAQEDADESLQLSIYAMAAREKWGYESDRLVFYNLEENSAVATARDRLQLQEARAKVEEVANRIAQGDFDPTPGYHCRFCSYRNLCPATEKQLYSIAPGKQAANN